MDRPPDNRLTLEDMDFHGLRLEAACPACKGYREVGARNPFPGWSNPRPLLEMFDAGKMPCKLHGKPATRMKITRWINMGMGAELIGEWERD